MSLSLSSRGSIATKAALASVAMAVILLGLKAWAAVSTGSVAMLGSLADTTLDLLASLVTLFGVWVAAQPADHDHRFGHGKAEALAALFQTMLISASAVWIAWRAILRLQAPVTPEAPELGIGVSLFAMVATLALVAYQRRVVKQTGSIAIQTDQLHYQSDLLLNAAVIAALALDRFAGLLGADAVFGLLIAVYLAWGATRAARHAIDMLMDKEWDDARRNRITTIVSAHPIVHGLHELKTRTSGATDFIQFHVWVDGNMTVTQAHDVVDELEDAVSAEFPGAEILIHVDPAGHSERYLAATGQASPKPM